MSAPSGALIAAAINAGKPIATRSEGWSMGAIGIWLGLGVIVPLLITAMVKLIPIMKKLAMEHEASIDEERRGDMVAMRKRMDLLEAKVEKANEKATAADQRASNAENRLSTAVVVIRILSAKIRAEWPDDPILRDVGELINAATTGDFGVGNGLARIIDASAKP